MTFTIATGLQNALAAEITVAIDGGVAAGGGILTVYDDTAARPASANDPVPGASVALAQFTLADPAFGAPANGTVTLNGLPIDVVGLADGTALWGRITDSDGNAVIDGDVGTDFVMNTTTVSTGVDVSLTAGSMTMSSGE